MDRGAPPGSFYANSPPASPYVDPTAIWQKLKRRNWTIVGVSAALLLISIPTLFILPPWYKAQTEITIDERSHGVDIAAVLSHLPTDSEAVLTEVEALRSRSLARDTILRLGLLDNPEFNSSLPNADDGSIYAILMGWKAHLVAQFETLRAWIEGKPKTKPDPSEVMSDATDIFLKHLEVVPIGRSRVIRASFISKDPELATAAINTLASLFISREVDHRLSIGRQVNESLKEQLADMRTSLDRADQAVEDYRNRAGLIQGVVQGRDALLTTQEISDVNLQLIAAKSKRQEAEARLGVINQQGDSAIETLQNPLIRSLNQQEASLRQKAADIATMYGPRHPKLMGIEASIADLDQKIRVEVGKSIASLRNEVILETQHEVSLEKRFLELKDNVQLAGKAQAHLVLLEDEAQSSRRILDAFLAQYKQSNSEQALQVADAYVISKADVPYDPSFPNTLMFVPLCCIGSLAVGAGAGLALERERKAIKSTDDVQALLMMRGLGLVPQLRKRTPVATQVLEKPQSTFSESIRNLLSTLRLLGDCPQVILLASAEPNEGKTSIAVSLGRLAAQSGKRAVMVDCDLRRPALHEVLGLDREPGLIQLLTGQSDLPSALQRDPMTEADVIASGGSTPDAPTLFAGKSMKELVLSLRERYDVVILDTPPSSSLSDARMLARFADHTVFVVRWDRTPRHVVRNSVARLEEAGGTVAGVLVTRVNQRKHARYDYSDSGWYGGDHRKYYSE